MKASKRAAVLVTMLVALTVTAGCERATEQGPAAARAAATPAQSPRGAAITDSSPTTQLRVGPVELAQVPVDELVAPGRVIANPNRIARVLLPVAGRVLKVLARLGDVVAPGQALLTLDSPDADAAISAYLQAETTERQAQVTLTKAEADLKRTRDLFEYKAVPEKDVLTAENDQAQARAARENARATRDQTSRRLDLLGLKPTDLKQPVIVHAPIGGTITEINVTPGEYRAAVSYSSDTTTPLMSISDLSTVWMSSDVPELSVRFIRVGDRVEITLLAYPGEVFSGRVTRMADTLDPQTRTLKVYVELPNPDGRLRPEMFASVRHAGTSREMPILPAGAIVREYGRTVVFVEKAPGQYERRQITVGPQVGDAFAVLAGLQAGQRVVVDGAMLLKDR
jgi:membrane fusion protein, heavy metal efflux system